MAPCVGETLRCCGYSTSGTPPSTSSLKFGCNQVPSIRNLSSYYRLKWLWKVCRMTDDRLPLRTLSGRIGRRGPGSPTQNLDRVCAGGFSPLIRIACGVWNIHELVVTVQRQRILDNSYSQAQTNKQTDVEREQFGLQYIRYGVSRV
jgi:hypothetical protein